jgi:DNA-binding GntR family transcriptional regulator
MPFADLAHQVTEFRRPHRLPSEVVRVLETAIIYGELDPGARLIEEEMALRYGVSRSPVREAFRLLEHDGLIVRGAKGGVRVAGVSRADLDEVYACRVALESLAAEEAAASRGKNDLAVLRRAYQEMEQARGEGDVRGYFRLNVALSKAIHAATGNQTLIRLLSMIDKQAQRYRYLAYVKSPHLIDLSLEGNKEILEAIAEGQRKPARKVTARLIRRSWQAIAAHFDEETLL